MTEQHPALIEKVTTWLSKSGYPLEMDVAALVCQRGFLTFQSEYYYDRQAREMREIDVVGVLGKHAETGDFRLTIAVECKSSRGKPWVVFTTMSRGRGPTHITDRAASKAGEDFLEGISERRDMQELPIFRRPDRTGYSVVRALGDGPDVPYAAMMSAAKAAQALADEATGVKAETVAEIVLPVVVVDGGLFECYLSETGQRVIAETPRRTVYWRNPIAGHTHSVVTVTTLAELPAYLTEVRESFARLTAECGPELKAALTTKEPTPTPEQGGARPSAAV